ncbi:MAG: methyltransferase domain-containing protein [Pseudodesulfovibrio sp.]|nr:methyltransferase domain-containing protein [Pseudodesulfovibrio sp.]
MADNDDRAGQQFWDENWKNRELPAAVNPSHTSLDYHVDQRFHDFFTETFTSTQNKKLLEVGCAGSRWLPYFFKQYGFDVTGLDYSPEGCAQAREMLRRNETNGTIHQGDLFQVEEELKESFDIVVSFGLVEHFSDTTATIRALAGLLKPKGILITMVPNVTHIPGTLMRLLNREVYDAHVPMSPSTLEKAADASELTTTHAGYFLSLNLSALSLAIVKRPQSKWNTFILRSFSALSKIVWLANRSGLPEWPNKVTSPFILHSAIKS